MVASAIANSEADDRDVHLSLIQRVIVGALLLAGVSLALRRVYPVGGAAWQVYAVLALAAVVWGTALPGGWLTRLCRWCYGHAVARAVVSISLIGAYIVAAYGPGLDHAFLNPDEIPILAQVYRGGAWVGFLEPLPRFPALYRPLFAVNAWTLHSLFGVNYAAYYWVHLVVLIATCGVVAALCRSMSPGTGVALLAALLFATHSFTSDFISGWVIDTLPYTGLLAAAVAALLWRWPGGWRWGAVLVGLLVLAGLSRENGLAIVCATGLYAIVGGRSGSLDRRQVMALCAFCVLSLVIYLAIRSIGSPGLRLDLGTVEEESAIFGRLYEEPEVRDMLPGQRIQLYGYTVLANLIGNFAMLFSGFGVLRLGRPEAWIMVAALSMFTTVAMRMCGGGLSPGPRVGARIARCATLAVGWLMACLATGALLYATAPQLPRWTADLLLLQAACHTVLSVGVVVAMSEYRRWPPALRAQAAFALGLILASSLLAFPYYRYRSHYVSYVGWVLLFVIALTRLNEGQWRRALRSSMAIVAALLILINGARVHASLPNSDFLPEHYSYRGYLCDPGTPGPLVEAIAVRFRLDMGRLDACRTSAR